MKIFLDTSALFKLYHQEAGTVQLEAVFTQANITHVFLSEIAKVEFASAIWKKVRTKEISEQQARTTLQLFEEDFRNYSFIVTDSLILEEARMLMTKYGTQGLRTLDSIQLSTCCMLSGQVDVFFTADALLQTLLEAEGLRTQISSG